jgi:hypothetical protein
MQDELLDVLACEIGLRPTDAPTLFSVSPHTRSIRKDGLDLLVEFEESAARDVERFAAAERLFCPGLDWVVATAPIVTLRIRGSATQVDLLEQTWIAATQE